MSSADHTVRGLRERPWREVEAPRRVNAVPSMLSSQELALLYWLARDYWSGAGRIIDAGSFQGGSTVALAAGLDARAATIHDRPPIVVYDQFRVEQYTLDEGFFSDADLHPGDDFRPVFQQNLHGLDHLLDVRPGDIIEQPWDGEPVEILFLDVLKTWPINDRIVREFWPSLIPGRAVVIQQDYQYGGYPWLAITMEQFGDWFERVDELPWATVVYRLIEPLPDLRSIPLSRDLPSAEKLRLMDRAISRETTAVGEAMLRLSRALLLQYLGHPIRARRELASVLSSCGDESVAHAAEMLAHTMRTRWSWFEIPHHVSMLRPLRSLTE